MFRSKVIRQENAKDCGATCLLMMMRRYGGNYPLEQLRELLMIDKHGTTAYNLIKAAEKVGFNANGYRCDNYENIVFPSIAHVIINKSYHHFVIIDNVDYKKETIIIIDPASGIKKYSFNEFNNIWSHIIITLYPNRQIDNVDTFKSVKKTFFKIIKPYIKFFIIIFILSVIYTILNILYTFYFKIIIDNILSTTFCFYLFIFFLILVLIKVFIDYIRNKILIYVNKKIDEYLMTDTLKHLLSLPFKYFNSRTTGDIISRLNDLNSVREFISRISIIVLVDFVLVIGSLIFMYCINCTLFLTAIAVLLVYMLIVLFYNRSIKSFIVKTQEANSLVSSTFVETINGIETIKNLRIEEEALCKATNHYGALVENNYLFDKKYNLIKLLKELITNGGIVVIIFLGSLLISSHTISVSDFILFSFFLNYFLEPMKNIFEMEPLLKASSNALVRTSEFYNVEHDVVDNNVLIDGDITLNNLNFSYNNQDKVINNLNLNILKGEKVMITGPSGCGKSTIARLLMQYFRTKPNQILINGHDILEYSPSILRNNICYVSQNEYIFTDSVYNNIILSRNIGTDRFEKILQMMRIDEITKKHNVDYHMLLEENGSNLSGGERQRIMIARALLRNSKVFIFDESMSEMDIELERDILKNIFFEYVDKTIIVISHRFNNSDLFDRVIAIENGI